MTHDKPTKKEQQNILAIVVAYLYSKGVMFLPQPNIKIEFKPGPQILKGLKIADANYPYSRCWHLTTKNLMGSLGHTDKVKELDKHSFYLETKNKIDTLPKDVVDRSTFGMNALDFSRLTDTLNFKAAKISDFPSFSELANIFSPDNPIIINCLGEEYGGGHTMCIVGLDSSDKTILVLDNTSLKKVKFENLASSINAYNEVIRKTYVGQEWPNYFVDNAIKKYEGKRKKTPEVTTDYVRALSFYDPRITTCYTNLCGFWVDFYNLQPGKKGAYKKWARNFESAYQQLKNYLGQFPEDSQAKIPAADWRNVAPKLKKHPLTNSQVNFVGYSHVFSQAVFTRQWDAADNLLKRVIQSGEIVYQQMKKGELKKFLKIVNSLSNEEIFFKQYSSLLCPVSPEKGFGDKTRLKINQNKGYLKATGQIAGNIAGPLFLSHFVDANMPNETFQKREDVKNILGLVGTAGYHRWTYYNTLKQYPHHSKALFSYSQYALSETIGYSRADTLARHWRAFSNNVSRTFGPVARKKVAVAAAAIAIGSTLYNKKISSKINMDGWIKERDYSFNESYYIARKSVPTLPVFGYDLLGFTHFPGALLHYGSLQSGLFVAHHRRRLVKQFAKPQNRLLIQDLEKKVFTEQEKKFLQHWKEKTYQKKFIQYHDIIQKIPIDGLEQESHSDSYGPGLEDLQMSYSRNDMQNAPSFNLLQKINVSLPQSSYSQAYYEIDFNVVEERIKTGKKNKPVIHIIVDKGLRKLPVSPHFVLDLWDLVDLEKYIQLRKTNPEKAKKFLEGKPKLQKPNNNYILDTSLQYGRMNSLGEEIIKLNNELQAIKLLHHRSAMSYYLAKTLKENTSLNRYSSENMNSFWAGKNAQQCRQEFNKIYQLMNSSDQGNNTLKNQAERYIAFLSSLTDKKIRKLETLFPSYKAKLKISPSIFNSKANQKDIIKKIKELSQPYRERKIMLRNKNQQLDKLLNQTR